MPEQIRTLEQFLEDQCGMAPKNLVAHYEEHREWVEEQLKIYNEQKSDWVVLKHWPTFVCHVWLGLPDLPKDW